MLLLNFCLGIFGIAVGIAFIIHLRLLDKTKPIVLYRNKQLDNVKEYRRRLVENPLGFFAKTFKAVKTMYNTIQRKTLRFT